MRRRAIGRASLALLLLGLVGVLVAGCSIPSWVPVVGRSKAEPNLSAADVRQPVKVAPLLPGTTGQRRASGDDVVDRVICIVNNDAITQYELDEAEAYYYYESKQPQPEGDARRALRDQLLQRIIESRLQLQQAEREKVVIEDAELAEQMGEILKRMNVKNDTELAEALKAQGLTVDSVKKRVRDTLMVQKVIRRKVTLRISVTEQEIDRYLEQNRNKLETGLTFAARHILFLPEPAGGDDAWQGARRRADEAYAHVLAGDDFAELAKKFSDDGSGKDGGGLGPLKRGELAPEIEAEILKLRPGEISPPFRSAVGYHLFKLDARESLAGEALTHARNQVREILFREKYQARLTEWLTEIRRRAMIDMRL